MIAPRARLYLRVSTKPRKPKPGEPPETPARGQTVENQRPDLEQIARARGFVVTGEYSEAESTKKRRPEFDRLMRDARRGELDVLLIWALDRLGRDTLVNMQTIAELDRVGVRVVSAQESWLDTTGPTRTLLVAIFSWVAEQERDRRSERTKAGLQRVREKGSRSGKPIGRPRRVDRPTLARALTMRQAGRSIREVAVALKIPRATLQRVLGQSQKGVTPTSSESPAIPTHEAGSA